MTIYAPGTPQDAIDRNEAREAGMSAPSKSSALKRIQPKLGQFQALKFLLCVQKLTTIANKASNASNACQLPT